MNIIKYNTTKAAYKWKLKKLEWFTWYIIINKKHFYWGHNIQSYVSKYNWI